MSKDLSFHRKLAAILAADVVGYSRMMEADEVGTLRQVQSVQKTCITPITAAYGGRLIKTTGDGFLFEFSSAVDAVLFAVDFQKKVQAAMASVAEARRIVFRVGVHAGDVLSDGVDMFGDGVNVAARLETLCAPGGICMSAVVQQQLHGKIELPLVDLGEHQVKNITRAIHAYGIEAGAIDLAAPAGLGGVTAILAKKRPWLWLALATGVALAAALTVPLLRHGVPASREADRPAQTFSIAVLPFTSLSNGTKPDDFADALVDNITTAISIGLPGATVISSASAFTYRGKDIDPPRVGRELGARYLLEGSVQKFSDHLRVNVQLVEAEAAAQLWTDQFDGPLTDIGALQDQITAGIANTLESQLIRLEADRHKNTANASALDLVFRGEALMMRAFSFATLDAAEENFRQALALDPADLAAKTELGNLLAVRVAGSIIPPRETPKAMLAEAQALLEQVRAQDPRRPELHNGLGLVYLMLGRIEDAAEQYRTEIEIDHNASGSYASLGECLTGLGRATEAIPLLEKSIRLNPRDPHIAYKYMDLMEAYFALKNYPEAIAQGERAYGEDSNDPRLVYMLASANGLQGNLEEAKAKLTEAKALQPGLTVASFAHIISKAPTVVEMNHRFCEGLRRAGLPE